MPVSSCDPASRGLPYNTVEQQDGPIWFECRFGHDGVSVPPDCDGPVSYLKVVNTGDVVWYANLPNKKRGDPWVEIPPGTNTELTAVQRRQFGLENYSDVKGVGLGPTPGG